MAIDLFCSFGGASWLLRALGYPVVLAGDWDAQAVDMYNKNHPGQVARLMDMYGVKKCAAIIDAVGPVDFGWGSAPCPGFCSTGKGKSDPSRALTPLWAECMASLKHTPAVLCFENVPNVRFSEEFAAAARTLVKVGYSLTWAVICASRFGACVARRRFYCVFTQPGVECTLLQRAAEGMARPPMPMKSLFPGVDFFWYFTAKYDKRTPWRYGKCCFDASEPYPSPRGGWNWRPPFDGYVPHPDNACTIEKTFKPNLCDIKIILGLGGHTILPLVYGKARQFLNNTVVPTGAAPAVLGVVWPEEVRAARARGARAAPWGRRLDLTKTKGSFRQGAAATPLSPPTERPARVTYTTSPSLRRDQFAARWQQKHELPPTASTPTPRVPLAPAASTPVAPL